jgi:acyl carrier protein
MTFIEKTYAMDVAMDDLDIENFKSVNATTAFVQRKKEQAR